MVMTIRLDNKQYVLDVDKALKSGVLTRVMERKLDLTEHEAAVLHFVLQRVGGPPDGQRGHVNRILSRLEAQGTPIPDTPIVLGPGITKGNTFNSIYFE